MSNPKVSVVMAVHNCEKYIVDALLSVQKQTYQDFECIIVDDHSTDNTVNIIYGNFCRRDNRFKLYLNCTDPVNPYVDAHNVSYELGSRNKYMIRFDGDDLMMPDHVETIVRYMEDHPECDAMCTNITRMMTDCSGVLVPYDGSITPGWGDREEKSVTEDNIVSFNKYPEWTYKDNSLSWFNQASCMRSSFYCDHKPMFVMLRNGDYLFWWNMLGLGANMQKIGDTTLIYRMHKESICHDACFKDNGDKEYNYRWQALIAEYKHAAFARRDPDFVYPDGHCAGDISKIFDNTVKYFIKLLNEYTANGE